MTTEIIWLGMAKRACVFTMLALLLIGCDQGGRNQSNKPNLGSNYLVLEEVSKEFLIRSCERENFARQSVISAAARNVKGEEARKWMNDYQLRIEKDDEEQLKPLLLWLGALDNTVSVFYFERNSGNDLQSGYVAVRSGKIVSERMELSTTH